MIDEDGSVTCDSHGRPLNPKGNESYESDKKIVNLKDGPVCANRFSHLFDLPSPFPFSHSILWATPITGNSYKRLPLAIFPPQRSALCPSHPVLSSSTTSTRPHKPFLPPKCMFSNQLGSRHNQHRGLKHSAAPILCN